MSFLNNKLSKCRSAALVLTVSCMGISSSNVFSKEISGYFDLTTKTYSYLGTSGSYTTADSYVIADEPVEVVTGFGDKVIAKKGDIIFVVNGKYYVNGPTESFTGSATVQTTNATASNNAVALEGLSAEEQDIVNATNRLRASAGLGLLTVDATLMQSSRAKSGAMARTGRMSHNAGGLGMAGSAENVAYNQSSGAEAVTSWYKSPGHNRNMMNPSYTKIGVGGVNLYWTQQFK